MAGRNHDRSDVSRDHKSRDKDYFYRGDTRDGDQTSRDLDKRGSAGDSRAKQNRQRDATTASDMEMPVHRGRYLEGPSRM